MLGGPIFFKVDKDSVIEVKMEDIKNDDEKKESVSFLYNYYDGSQYAYYLRTQKNDLLKNGKKLSFSDMYKKDEKIIFPQNIETEYFIQDGWYDGNYIKIKGDRFVKEGSDNTYYANLKEKTQNIEVRYLLIGKNGEKILKEINMEVGKADPIKEIIYRAEEWRKENEEKFWAGDEVKSTYGRNIMDSNACYQKINNEYNRYNCLKGRKEEDYIERDKLNSQIRESGKFDVYFAENYKNKGYYYNVLGEVFGVETKEARDNKDIIVPGNIDGVEIKDILNLTFGLYNGETNKYDRLIFEEGIERIGKEALDQGYGTRTIIFNELILPDSLKEIENKGFLKLSVGTIKFGNGNLTIGDDAFGTYKDENGLRGVVHIPKNVQYIGSNAFCGTKVEKFIVTDEDRYNINWNITGEISPKYFPIEHEK